MAEVKYTEMIPQYIGMKIARGGSSIKDFASILGTLQFAPDEHTISALADEYVNGVYGVEIAISLLNDYYAGDANV